MTRLAFSLSRARRSTSCVFSCFSSAACGSDWVRVGKCVSSAGALLVAACSAPGGAGGAGDSGAGTNSDTSMSVTAQDNSSALGFVDVSNNSSSGDGLSNSIGCGESNNIGFLRDFTDAHPDFENLPDKGKAYGVDPGIVGPLGTAIGNDRKPVYMHDDAGTLTTSGPQNFSDWFNTREGINMPQAIEVGFSEDPPGSGLFVYDAAPQGGFFPIDNLLLGNQGREHNYHFTFELHTKFVYNPGDTFKFRGDDDVWVYIKDYLACDLGGVHQELECLLELDVIAPEFGLEPGQEYPLDFFFAERHVIDSNFRIETTLVFTGCEILR